MRSLRVLTAVLVVLVLVPAGVLGGLGIRGTDRYETEMRQRIAQEMARVRESASAEALAFASEEALDAEAAAFGRGDADAAVAIWRSAAARLVEPAWKARAEVEASLLEQGLGRGTADAETRVVDLERRFSRDVLERTGRPWTLLLLR